MFLSLNKKNLKELSNSKITLSLTYEVKGGGSGSDTGTDKPSKTQTRCVPELVQKVGG